MPWYGVGAPATALAPSLSASSARTSSESARSTSRPTASYAPPPPPPPPPPGASGGYPAASAEPPPTLPYCDAWWDASRLARSCAMLRSTGLTRTSWKRTDSCESIACDTGFGVPRSSRCPAFEPMYPEAVWKRSGSAVRSSRSCCACSSRMALARACAAFVSTSVVVVSLSLTPVLSSVAAFGRANGGSSEGSPVASSAGLVGILMVRPVRWA